MRSMALRRVTVKRIFGITALAACLSLLGAGQAKAAGPFYVYFADYCDCITLTRVAAAEQNWYYGTWDWECSGGVSSTLINGIIENGKAFLGTQPLDANGVPAGFSVMIALEKAGLGSDHADVTAFDGLTETVIAQEADYYLRTQPPCPGPPNTKPRMFP